LLEDGSNWISGPSASQIFEQHQIIEDPLGGVFALGGYTFHGGKKISFHFCLLNCRFKIS